MDFSAPANVLTVIADPAVMPLNELEQNAVISALEDSGARVQNVDWLAKETAFDIFFSHMTLADARGLMNHLLANVPFDFVVQHTEKRRKKLLISDMDSTMITVECIDEMADMLGIKPQIAEITDRAMNGLLDFKTALRERVSLLKGLPAEKLEQVYKERIVLMPGARELVGTMRKNGALCVLVSGGFTYFTERVAQAAGFEQQEANILEIENGALTGKVREPILDKEAKLAALKFHAESIGADLSETLAVGDGANDLPMIKSAGLGMAFRAKEAVKAEAWAHVDHCDLRALLFAQGYRESDITTF